MSLNQFSVELDRSLTIYYHPLYQEIVKLWENLFNQKQDQNMSQSKLENSEFQMDFLSFIEFNLKLQKCLIPKFEIQNAFLSALNDWLKEVQESQDLLETKKISKAEGIQKLKIEIEKQKEKEREKSTLVLQPEQYIQLVETFSNHQSFSLVDSKLTHEVFSKFLFDLCHTWSEFLDIELFSYFLLGLYLQLTQGQDLFENSCFKDIDSIQNLPQSFINIFEQKKMEYKNNKKKKLTYFRAWCDWNFLRLNDFGEDLILNLQEAYEKNDDRIVQFAGVFEIAIHIINEQIQSTSINQSPTKSNHSKSIHKSNNNILYEENSVSLPKNDSTNLIENSIHISSPSKQLKQYVNASNNQKSTDLQQQLQQTQPFKKYFQGTGNINNNNGDNSAESSFQREIKQGADLNIVGLNCTLNNSQELQNNSIIKSRKQLQYLNQNKNQSQNENYNQNQNQQIQQQEIDFSFLNRGLLDRKNFQDLIVNFDEKTGKLIVQCVQNFGIKGQKKTLNEKNATEIYQNSVPECQTTDWNIRNQLSKNIELARITNTFQQRKFQEKNGDYQKMANLKQLEQEKKSQNNVNSNWIQHLNKKNNTFKNRPESQNTEISNPVREQRAKTAQFYEKNIKRKPLLIQPKTPGEIQQQIQRACDINLNQQSRVQTKRNQQNQQPSLKLEDLIKEDLIYKKPINSVQNKENENEKNSIQLQKNKVKNGNILSIKQRKIINAEKQREDAQNRLQEDHALNLFVDPLKEVMVPSFFVTNFSRGKSRHRTQSSHISQLENVNTSLLGSTGIGCQYPFNGNITTTSNNNIETEMGLQSVKNFEGKNLTFQKNFLRNNKINHKHVSNPEVAVRELIKNRSKSNYVQKDELKLENIHKKGLTQLEKFQGSNLRKIKQYSTTQEQFFQSRADFNKQKERGGGSPGSYSKYSYGSFNNNKFGSFNEQTAYMEQLENFQHLWRPYIDREELEELANWGHLYKIIQVLKKRYDNERKKCYMDYLHIDISPNYQEYLRDKRVEEMGGEITDSDKIQFSKRMDKLMRRDNRRQKRKKKKLMKKPGLNYNIKDALGRIRENDPVLAIFQPELFPINPVHPIKVDQQLVSLNQDQQQNQMEQQLPSLNKYLKKTKFPE